MGQNLVIDFTGLYDVGNWWYWINIGRYWLMKDAVFGDWAVYFDSAVT